MRFSCIIPAYNEGPRIRGVLETALSCEKLDEVIVVNDGSTDHTREVIESIHHTKLKKIHQHNTGKAGALFRGIEESIGSHIVMLDADLVGLTEQHIEELILPIVNSEFDITLSIRENSYSIYKWLGSDFVSGERVVPREIFENKAYYTDGPGFGLEVKMNAVILEKKYRIKNVYLRGMISERKNVKMGFVRGTLADWKMTYQILSVMPLHRIIAQAWYFSRFHSNSSAD